MKARAKSLVVAAATLLGLSPSPARAQVAANERWSTIRTTHVNVHFTRTLEAVARHVAAVAERAYENLAGELATPRGRIDLVVSDAADLSNGSATVIPRPEVVIYARPPIDARELESYDDWTVLVVQHELTHIFQLDRSLGWWRVAQDVFGRNLVLFPNYYTPSWLTEGVAVYYESRFTSGGRLEGTFHGALARAAAVDRAIPRIDALSQASTTYPYGEAVYVYGSDIVSEAAAHGGAGSMRRFVDRYSAETIPFLLDRVARRTFGETFTSAYRAWRDSVMGGVASATPSPPVLSAGDAIIVPVRGEIAAPRWRDAVHLLFSAYDGRETPAVYELTLPAGGGDAPAIHRVARRNALGVNVPSGDSIVFAQPERTDRFHLRSDLFVRRDGAEMQITHGARLSQPDVATGAIVAVRTLPGRTTLSIVAHDSVRDIAPDIGDWTTPRWSPAGRDVAAVESRSGANLLVTIDATTRAVRMLVGQRAVVRSPAWTPSGRSLLFTSDQSGASQLAIVASDGAAGTSDHGTRRRAATLTAEPGGVFEPDVVAFGDSVRVAATVLRANGYRLAVWTLPAAMLDSIAGAMPADDTPLVVPIVDPRWRVADDTSPAHRFSPWRTLVPAYWSPTFASDAGHGATVGALTSASDPIGRHAYDAALDVNTRNGNVQGSLDYAYNRFAEPALSFSLDQSWAYSTVTGSGHPIGELSRRARAIGTAATFIRARVRSSLSASLGVAYEERAYVAEPPTVLAKLDPFYDVTHHYVSLSASLRGSNAVRPVLAISAEDGATFSVVARQRWERGAGEAGRSIVGAATAYKSIDLGGFAHDVLALRVAAGGADRRSPDEFRVGGVSGSSLEIIPGVTFGGSPRTFPVRGYDAGAEAGIVATGATAELRLPLARISRGLGVIPAFLDRASMSLFGDAGRAVCPGAAQPACAPASVSQGALLSVGGELALDAALQYDVPYRFRAGLAKGLTRQPFAAAPPLKVYATLGVNF